MTYFGIRNVCFWTLLASSSMLWDLWWNPFAVVHALVTLQDAFGKDPVEGDPQQGGRRGDVRGIGEANNLLGHPQCIRNVCFGALGHSP